MLAVLLVLTFLDYNWFPEGKIVFVAPTRPLVAQQIEASHQVCGIPGTTAVELTGQNPVPMRARAVRRPKAYSVSANMPQWKEMRVFYMTPQTLYNDLMSKTCDATDIVLIVFGARVSNSQMFPSDDSRRGAQSNG